MPSLVPVDIDPFAPSSSTTGNLIPVDHDPFAENPGFFNRIEKDFVNRGEATGKAIKRTNLNPLSGRNFQTPLETALQVGSQGAGFLALDLPLEAAKSFWNYTSTPQMNSGISEIGKIINETGGPQAAAQSASPLIQRIDQWTKNNPVLSADIGAVGNMYAGAPMAKPIASVVEGAGKVVSGVPTLGKVFKPKDPSLALSNINPDARLEQVVGVLKKRYGTIEKVEDAAWNTAREMAKGASINGDFANGIRDRAEGLLSQEAKSLGDADMAPIREKLSNFTQYGSKNKESNILDALGNPIAVKVKNDIPVSQLIALRKGISTLSAKSPDGNVRYYAGKILSDIDEQIGNIAKTGDVGADAAQSMLDAIGISRDKFKRFGTGKFQSKAFQNIIQNPDVGSADIGKLFGGTLRATPASEQFVIRAINEAGANKENVRNAFSQYIFEKAVLAAKQDRQGVTIIQPNILAKELDKILGAQTAKGGIGRTIRDAVFTPEDLEVLRDIRNNLPKVGVFRRVGREAISYIPYVGSKAVKLETASDAAGVKTLKNLIPILENGLKASRKGVKK